MPHLYAVDECPDLFVDACVCDEQRGLVFMSAWGRDTVVQEFFARLTLGSSEGGLEHFHVVHEQRSLPVFVGNVDMLDKRTTRTYKRTLFGSLVHLWIFDKRVARPDLANHVAFALLPPGQHMSEEMLWPLVRETCPLPLLDHWREQVLTLLHQLQMLSALPAPLGPVKAWRLSLRLDELETHLGQLIRQQLLTTTAQQA
ncbi:hypothetical protein [Pseudomonas caricapapayae]|uniref:hypothetical protein n=1 Tax=Pseudomonas caricapapayae TaxID=46678 RepID=UPI000F0037CB|nr:hypothetical protein [Pseudomonas caricapapayae]